MAQLRPGYTASPELQENVLSEWTALIDEWNLDQNYPLTKPDFTYAITGAGYNANNRDYEIGPSAAAGNFIGPRPVRILKANLVITTVTPNVRIPISVLPWRDYGDIPVLAIPPTGITLALYYEPTFPTGKIHFWLPVNANSLQIWQNGALVAPATLATVIGTAATPGNPEFSRTLLLYDTAAGNDIAPRLVAQGSGDAVVVRAVLRKAIAAPLTVRINVAGVSFATMTIPSATPVGTALAQTFAPGALISEAQVFSFDVLASDASADAGGVASFTIEWGALSGGATGVSVFPPGYENAIIFSVAERCQYLVTKELGPRNPKIAAWALKARQRIRNSNAQSGHAYTDFSDGRTSAGAYSPNLTYIGIP